MSEALLQQLSRSEKGSRHSVEPMSLLVERNNEKVREDENEGAAQGVVEISDEIKEPVAIYRMPEQHSLEYDRQNSAKFMLSPSAYYRP